MNFFTGTVAAQRRRRFRSAPTALRLPLGEPQGDDGRPAVYGVRPEHFTLADDGAAAEIQVVEPTGSETQLVAKLGGAEVRRGVSRTPPFQAGR